MEVTIKQLLEAGVHFGHQVKRWNPKMKEYIFTQDPYSQRAFLANFYRKFLLKNMSCIYISKKA